MGKRIAVIFRHGDYEKQMAGDGPLTDEGKRIVRNSTNSFAAKLAETFPGCVNVAITALVSGSLRGLDTYRWIRDNRTFQSMRNIEPGMIAGIEGCFYLQRESIRTEFFSHARGRRHLALPASKRGIQGRLREDRLGRSTACTRIRPDQGLRRPRGQGHSRK